MEYFLPVQLKLGHIFTNHFPSLTYITNLNITQLPQLAQYSQKLNHRSLEYHHFAVTTP